MHLLHGNQLSHLLLLGRLFSDSKWPVFSILLLPSLLLIGVSSLDSEELLDALFVVVDELAEVGELLDQLLFLVKGAL
jgi:hypothetical protein